MDKGELIYKSLVEHHDEHTGFFGNPYYTITKIEDEYYLWKFDVKKRDYVLLKKGKEFEPLYEEALEASNRLWKELRKKSW